MLVWVVDNWPWIVGGATLVSATVAVFTFLITVFRRRSGGANQIQSSGANSTNVQAGRDANLNTGSSREDDGR